MIGKQFCFCCVREHFCGDCSFMRVEWVKTVDKEIRNQGFISNYFKNWSHFERVLLVLSLVVPTSLGAIFQSGLIQIGASSITMIASLLFAKARIEGYLLSLLGMILFCIVAFNNRLFGEVGVSLFFGLPALIVGFVGWSKALKKGKVNEPAKIEIRKTGFREVAILALICGTLGIGLYFLLGAIDTNLLLLSTISVVFTIFGTLLMIRRSHLGTLGFALNDISNIFLWLMIVLMGDISAIVMIVQPVLLLVNNTYGIFVWRKMLKAQESSAGAGV